MKRRTKHNKGINKNISILVLLAVGLAIAVIFLASYKPDILPTQKLIGGERDEHGCLGPAGYTYNEQLAVCARDWELEGTKFEAARIASDYLINAVGEDPYGLTVVEITQTTCDDCFDLLFNKIDNTEIRMTVHNGLIIN